MTTEDLKKCLINIFDSCYSVIHEDNTNIVYLFYDDSIIRKMKLCKLKNIKFKINNIKGKCLFVIDYTNYYLYYDYLGIYSFFENNYSSSYDDIQKIICSILKEQYKLKVLLPSNSTFLTKLLYKEECMYKLLTPRINILSTENILKEENKLKVLYD